MRSERNPQEALQWLAQSYGVDLGTADTERVRQQAYAEMQQQQQWEQQKQQWEQHQQQQRQLQAHVEKFAAERAAHWPAIENDVLYFIPAEKARNPEGDPRDWFRAAYNKAMASRPDLDSTKKAEAKKSRRSGASHRINERQIDRQCRASRRYQLAGRFRTSLR